MTHLHQNFRSFCLSTSLHGWQYMVAEGGPTKLKKYFWGAIVCFSMVAAGFFLYTNTWDFINSNVVTTVDTMTAPLSDVYFPSVVICNINQVRESYFEEVISTLDYSAISNKTLDTNLGGTHQLCKDMFMYSIWNGSTTYHFEVERDFGTDYGICCWYTPQFNFTEILEHSRNQGLEEPDWGFWFTQIQKGAKTGKDNGYTILLDVESFDYKFFKEGSEGLKVALVHHLDMPIMRQTGFHISPGTENQIAITPTLLATTLNAMDRFSPEQRDCYNEGEIELKYLPRDHGYRYEMSNCLFEATFEHILERCKCFPGFHTTSGSAGNYSLCVGKELTCVNELMNRMGQFDHVDYHGKQVKCRSNCEDQSNSLFVTSSAYPNKGVFTMRHEFCLLMMRLITKCKSFKRGPLSRMHPKLCELLEGVEVAINAMLKQKIEHPYIEECPFRDWKVFRQYVPDCDANACEIEDIIWKYARRNLAILNIFIKDPYVKKFMKDIKITKTSYIANSGGILGLCMGFSLISAAEILFHCCLSFWKRRKQFCSGSNSSESSGSRGPISRAVESENCPEDCWPREKNEHMKQEENRDYDWPNTTDYSDSDENDDDNDEDDDYPKIGREPIHQPPLGVAPSEGAENHIECSSSVKLCPDNHQIVHVCDRQGHLYLPPLPPPPPISYRRAISSSTSGLSLAPVSFRGPERII